METSFERNPIITEKDGDLMASIRSKETYIVFTLRNMSYMGGDLNTVLTCCPVTPSSEGIPYTTRINLLSTSARDSLVRSLKSAFTEDVNWTMTINTLCSSVEKYLSEQQQLSDLSEVEEDTNSYLLHPFLAENSANMLFGKGGTGKSYLSIAMALSVSSGEPFLDYTPTTQKNVLFLDYESTKNVFARRVRMVDPTFNTKGRLFYYGMSSPLADSVDMIKRRMTDNNIGFVVVDSAALAAGGKPEDAVNALTFFSALKKLNTTTLVIAHETKAENKSYPFGSVFFFNNLRNIWNASSQQDDLGSDALNLGLFHRKSNEDKIMAPRGVRIYFGKDRIEFSKGTTNLWEQEQSHSSRVYQLMRDGTAGSPMQISKDLGINYQTVKSTITRLKKDGRIDKEGDGWKVIEGNSKPNIMNLPTQNHPANQPIFTPDF